MKPPLPPINSFTTQYDKITNMLVNDVHIATTYNSVSNQPENPIVFKALWDTGATNSMVTERVVQACKLAPFKMTRVSTASGTGLSPVFLVGMGLPNKVWIPNIHVSLGKLSGDIDVLIGMDVICLGDFAITHQDGRTTFSFRVPSIEHIDFVKQSNLVRTGPKIKPNDPCPCKSGKKFKHCHGQKGRKTAVRG